MSSNLRLLKALRDDLTDLIGNLETLEDACYTAPNSSRYGRRIARTGHSDPTGKTVAKYEEARKHLKQADKGLRGPILSFMGRLSGQGGVSYHVRVGMRELSKGPDERARHEAGEAPSRESA